MHLVLVATRTADVEACGCFVVGLEPVGSDVVELGMIQGIEISDGVATINIALTIAACPMRDQIESQTSGARSLHYLGISSTVVNVAAMTSKTAFSTLCRRCASLNDEPVRLPRWSTRRPE